MCVPANSVRHKRNTIKMNAYGARCAPLRMESIKRPRSRGKQRSGGTRKRFRCFLERGQHE